MSDESNIRKRTHKLSVIIPCYNEMATLRRCVANVINIANDSLTLEIIIVDDHSADESPSIANGLSAQHEEIRVLRHPRNVGKGANQSNSRVRSDLSR